MMLASISSFAQEKKSFVSHLDINGKVVSNAGFLQNNFYGQSGAFANFQFIESISAYDIPVNVVWNATRLPSGKFQFDNFNVSFSRNEMLRRLSEKEDSLTKLKNIDNRRIDSLTKILSDPDYLKLVSIAKIYLTKYKTDSVKHSRNNVDSLMARMDTVSSSLNDSIENFTEPIDTSRLSEHRETVTAFEKTKQIYFTEIQIRKSKLEALKSNKDSLDKNGIDSTTIRKKSHRILANFETVNFGVQSASDSWLTLYNYNFNGLKLKYTDGRVIAGITTGINRRISFDNLATGSLSNVILENQNGRNFYSLSAGLGQIGNNTVFSFYRFDEDVNELQPSRAVPISILSLNIEKEIFNDIQVAAVVAKNINSEQQSEGEDYSGSFELKSYVKPLKIDVKGKYVIVGDDYFSPGNMYLTTSYRSMSGDLQKALFENKLKLTTRFEKATSNDWNRTSISIGSDLKMGSRINLGLKYSLSTYFVIAAEEEFKNESQFYQASLNYKLSSKCSIKGVVSKSVSESANGGLSFSDNYNCTFQYKGKASLIQIQNTIYKNVYSGLSRIGFTTAIMHSISIKKFMFNERVSFSNNGRQNTVISSIGINYAKNKTIAIGLQGSRNDFISNGELVDYNSSYQVQMSLTVSY